MFGESPCIYFFNPTVPLMNVGYTLVNINLEVAFTQESTMMIVSVSFSRTLDS